MNLHIKTFEQLSSRELYEILKARCAVFVVEQTCPYQDLDGGDYDSLHVYLEENGEILAYLRCYMKDDETARIGRVLTLARGQGYGRPLMDAGIAAVKEHYRSAKSIFIEAQCYAIGYYEKFGFAVCGEEFLEDGIPHVPMTLDLSAVSC